jgi:hypothetical protein
MGFHFALLFPCGSGGNHFDIQTAARMANHRSENLNRQAEKQ